MPDPINPLEVIDPYSRTVVLLTMYFANPDSPISQRQELATATGFIREIDGRYFLMTARHNLTGCHPETKKPISSTCAIPNEVEIEGARHQITVPLYEAPRIQGGPRMLRQARAPEWRLTGQHLPERYAKRIQIRTDVHSQTGELLGTGKLRGSSKNSRHRNRRPRIGFGYRLRQPKVDNLSRSNTFPREANHNVARFDVPVNEVLSVDRGQTGGHLLHVHYAGPGCFACRVDRA